MPETSEKHRSRLVRILTNKYLIVTVLFMVTVLVVDRNNVIRWAGDYLQVRRQEKAIRQYRKDIKTIDSKLDELTSDRDSLEKFAREQYFFQRENEEVFIVD